MNKLPKGFIPLQYIKIKPSQRYLLTGFTDQNKVIQRIAELKEQNDAFTYTICAVTEQVIKEYAISLPEEATIYLTESEKENLVPESLFKPITIADKQPIVYRFIEEKYIKDFFDNGNLMISTYSRCKQLESSNRRDEKEGSNTLNGTEDDLKVEMDVEVGEDALILCTSLSKNHVMPDGSKYDACIEIVDINRFVEAITNKLIIDRHPVAAALKGPCTYAERIIERELDGNSIRDFLEKTDNTTSFDFNLLNQFAAKIGREDTYFRKEIKNAYEHEYRIVWLLDQEPEEEFYIINVPEAKSFCRKVLFKQS